MSNRRLAGLFALAIAALPAVASGQKEPRRPKLPAGADTNSAQIYYNFALQQLRHDPDKAADALYWAARLEPMWADAYYARRVALLLTDNRRLMRYWSGDRRTIQSDDIRRIDSLFYHALTLNPFVSQRLDRQIFEEVADEIAHEAAGGSGEESAIRFEIDRMMSTAPPATKAWLAYGDGRFEDALPLYDQAIRSDKRNEPLRMDRARVFFQMNQMDSALAELTKAVQDLRTRDKKDLVFVYQSKALAEHSVAIVQERLGHDAEAKEALGRALQEDLSYYPAHTQLAFLALNGKDTTTALAEFDLAVQLRADDDGLQYLYGFILTATGKPADAEPHLRKAISLNPVYAAPHFILAQILERSSMTADAAKEYATFLSLAASTDLRRNEATTRVAALKTGG
jgi:tetratricopeptide (TPR) repeat protein